nr:hypothetical protein [Tanacetum cinerariifolium]
EDPHRLLDYGDEEDPKMDREEEEPEEEPVEEAGVEPEAKGADVELEAKEPDGVSESTIGTEILHPNLSGVEETLGKMVERLKVLESEENATLRKKLTEKEVLLDLTRMERDRTEKRLSELI